METVDKILKNEAIQFYETSLLRSVSLGKINDVVSNKLYDFKTYRDKYKFLVFLRQMLDEAKVQHDLKCKKEVCRFNDNHEVRIFAVEQELEQVSELLETYEPPDRFTAKEQIDIIIKIDNIIERLSNDMKQRFDKLDAGQEVLFTELEDLKERLNLGKKAFGQMVMGKVGEMVVTNVVDNALGNELYNSILDGFRGFKLFLK